LRINVQRCIDTFGRHNTDQVLPPRPRAALTPESAEGAAQEKKPRAGPDTGSSEVQIAILTAKIRTMANMLEKNGNGDKHNKRNLRVLVHKRQKLLKYLRRKERGGPRWQNLIETLGLTEGTWKGEISL
jgi:ribosomal protein S15